MKNNQYTGVWIPKEVLKIGIKNGNERILFSMILMLSKNSSCTASNGYLSERLQLSKGQISRLISELQNKNLVNIFVDRSNGNKRKITINKEYTKLCANLNIGIEDKSIPIRKDDDTLYANMSINNKEDTKDRYNIYIDFSAISFLIKNAEERFKVFEMQYKKTITDYTFFLKYYETKVQEEELVFTVNKLLGRLNRLALNWNTSSKTNGYSTTSSNPLIKPKRLN
jgi:DNA-binding transcriptional regulator GbsR (MarR family)